MIHAPFRFLGGLSPSGRCPKYTGESPKKAKVNIEKSLELHQSSLDFTNFMFFSKIHIPAFRTFFLGIQSVSKAYAPGLPAPPAIRLQLINWLFCSIICLQNESLLIWRGGALFFTQFSFFTPAEGASFNGKKKKEIRRSKKLVAHGQFFSSVCAPFQYAVYSLLFLRKEYHAQQCAGVLSAEA
jgi:hypothetical protein